MPALPLPDNRSDATTSATTHAADHNNANASINVLAHMWPRVIAVGCGLEPVWGGTNTTNVSVTAGQVLFVPFIVPQDLTFDNVYVSMNTYLASSTIRIGMYNSSATTMFPSTLITSADVSPSDTNQASAAMSMSLAAGFYWQCYTVNQTSSWRAYSQAACPQIGYVPSLTGGPSEMTNASSVAQSQTQIYTSGFTWGALHANFSSYSARQFNPANNVRIIHRISALS